MTVVTQARGFGVWRGVSSSGMTSASRTAILHEVSTASPRGEDACRIVADWLWPDRPLVRVRVDDQEVATVDYLPASATAHWFLKWTSNELVVEDPNPLPLMPLVAMVPEEVDGDENIRAAVLDTALEAVANRLTGGAARIEPRDL
jgi:hypothetical protein